MSSAERLLDAVDEVIAEYGPSGVTLRRVGAAAGLSHTAAAHYYRDKPGLFAAYIARGWGRVADRLEDAARIEDPRQALLAAGDEYARFAVEEPGAFSVMDRLELARVETDELWAQRERGFFTLLELVERLQAQGWAHGHSPLDVLAANWSFVHGFVQLWVGGPLAAPYDGSDLRQTLQRLLTVQLAGFDEG